MRFDRANDEEEAFRVGHGITSSDPDDNPHARRLQELERLRIAVESQLTEHQAVVDQVAAAGDGSAETALDARLAIAAVAGHALVAEPRRLMVEHQTETAVIARRYGPEHPRMKQAVAELAVRRARLAEAVEQATAAFAAARDESNLRLQALNARIRVEEEALAKYRVDLLRMQALSQESATRAKLFDELRRKLAEEEVASRLESRQVVVNSPPEAGTRPANRFPSLFAAAAILLGGLAGIAAALIADRLDRRIRGEEGLRALADLPILATIPAFPGDLPTLTNARDADRPAEIGEAFRALRVALRLTSQFRDVNSADQGCCLVVTSASEGEGRSTVASRLGVSLAATGAKVLLIDADLRRPSLHQQFALAPGGGFSLLLAGEPQHAARTAFANLDLLWAGQRPPNPADLLHSPVLSWYIGEARNRYDWILFHAPPVTQVADAMVLAEHADAMVLVVRDRVSTRAAVGAALRRMQALGNRVIGFVLNGSREQGLEATHADIAEPPKPQPPASATAPAAEVVS